MALRWVKAMEGPAGALIWRSSWATYSRSLAGLDLLLGGAVGHPRLLDALLRPGAVRTEQGLPQAVEFLGVVEDPGHQAADEALFLRAQDLVGDLLGVDLAELLFLLGGELLGLGDLAQIEIGQDVVGPDRLPLATEAPPPAARRLGDVELPLADPFALGLGQLGAEFLEEGPEGQRARVRLAGVGDISPAQQQVVVVPPLQAGVGPQDREPLVDVPRAEARPQHPAFLDEHLQVRVLALAGRFQRLLYDPAGAGPFGGHRVAQILQELVEGQVAEALLGGRIVPGPALAFVEGDPRGQGGVVALRARLAEVAADLPAILLLDVIGLAGVDPARRQAHVAAELLIQGMGADGRLGVPQGLAFAGGRAGRPGLLFDDRRDQGRQLRLLALDLDADLPGLVLQGRPGDIAERRLDLRRRRPGGRQGRRRLQARRCGRCPEGPQPAAVPLGGVAHGFQIGGVVGRGVLGQEDLGAFRPAIDPHVLGQPIQVQGRPLGADLPDPRLRAGLDRGATGGRQGLGLGDAGRPRWRGFARTGLRFADLSIDLPRRDPRLTRDGPQTPGLLLSQGIDVDGGGHHRAGQAQDREGAEALGGDLAIAGADLGEGGGVLGRRVLQAPGPGAVVGLGVHGAGGPVRHDGRLGPAEIQLALEILGKLLRDDVAGFLSQLL